MSCLFDIGFNGYCQLAQYIIQNQLKICENASEKNIKKHLHFFFISFIITTVVTLIAKKREVAACHTQVFRGANVKSQ